LYTFYPSGTVNLEVRCSNRPFKIENETDRSRLLTFFGQVRDRLVTFLMDRHERIVPDIMEWNVTECDITKDMKVNDRLHFTGLDVQVKHLDHLLRIYIKSMGEDTSITRECIEIALKHEYGSSASKALDNTKRQILGKIKMRS
jgi:hypothetical protein